MSGFGNTEKNAILDASVGNATYKGALEYWLALTTVAVTGADTGATITEPTFTPYARIAMKNTEWTAAAAGEHHNNATKAWAEATAGESTLLGWALCEKKTKGEAGKVIKSGVLPPTVIVATIIPEFLAGALIFRISDT